MPIQQEFGSGVYVDCKFTDYGGADPRTTTDSESDDIMMVKDVLKLGALTSVVAPYLDMTEDLQITEITDSDSPRVLVLETLLSIYMITTTYIQLPYIYKDNFYL